MPIATIYLKNKPMYAGEFGHLVQQWAKNLNLDLEDICLTIITDFIQAGAQYDVMVTLFLPSTWSGKGVKRIQVTLLKLLMEHLKVEASGIFIMTSIIESEHVVENGEVVSWQRRIDGI